MIHEGKDYDVLLIDTSIYERNGLRLEKGLLRRLFQFRKSPIEFLMPDVIKNEVRAHLKQKIHSARSALEKSLNEAGDHLFFDGSALNDAKAILIDSKEIEDLADSRIGQFLENTGALVLTCGNYVSVSEILEQYFSEKPPFASSGKKKSEFPDAIVLLSVEAWATAKNKNVLAVVKDRDWHNYCDTSPRIDYTEDLSAAFDVFNQANAPYALISNIEQALVEGLSERFMSQISDALEQALDGFTPVEEADSSFDWEAEGSHGWFKDFEFVDHDFRVIDTDDDWVVLECLASITVEAEGEFLFSVYDSIDKDYVSIGGATVTTEEVFESEILITISGDLNGPLENLTIEEVEIVSQIESIDFGDIEPDFGEDEEFE
jgi:hypothetical protein